MPVTIKRFDERLAQMQWQPQAGPSPQIVDSVMAERPSLAIRGVEYTLAGAILGILIGVGLKGIYTPSSPWGPGTGTMGLAIGSAALAGAGLSLVAAVVAALRYRQMPRLMQFSSMNLLIIVMLLLS
ncbi:hypothetical protein [Phaeobacter porticola]|uniref:Uncharacterized protein n=1 Tax=Phaeobacter porticola TaxID=1844006 RepID=A0A1L3I3Z1_9RHOB|nr:hypothetical protein [Phaeobacter porticola]APG46831.1 hypothetical protein PhaeoP97_01410 [Phaeobacter porticola]